MHASDFDWPRVFRLTTILRSSDSATVHSPPTQVTDFNLSRVSRTDNVASVQSMVANNPRWQPPEVSACAWAAFTGLRHRSPGAGWASVSLATQMGSRPAGLVGSPYLP